MILAGARLAIGPTDSMRSDLVISRGRIRALSSRASSRATLDLTGCLILPGLINSHDHLEFNLFPRLGRGPYSNAAEWAKDIYKPDQPPIKQHLQIPKPLRILWGGVKNLLSGVTSVFHHNPYQASILEHCFPVRVVRHFGWAHSLDFCTDLNERYRATPPGAPFVIHACEGTDERSRRELYRLDEANVLGPSTVLVHGVALESKDLPLLKKRGASVIWCPTSNHFMFAKTVCRDLLDSGIPVALGSDSALTAAGDFIDELHAARAHLPLTRLYDMVTSAPAQILRLNSSAGSLKEGAFADLLVLKDEGQQPAEALLSINPQLVFVNGRVKLFSPAMADRLHLWGAPGFEPIELEGRGRWFIECPVSLLREEAVKQLGGALKLAGKNVLP